LVRGFFTTVTALLLVTVASGDCTPTGNHRYDVTSGVCYNGYEDSLSKTGYWNITWTDGHTNSLQPTGSGKCDWNSTCTGSFDSNQYCWPDFFQPVTTSGGEFTIHVRNYGTSIHQVEAGCIWPLTWKEVLCSITSEKDFSRSWTCPTNSDECEAQGYYWNFSSNTCNQDPPYDGGGGG